MKNRLITVPRSCLALMLAVALGGIAANLARADFIDINPVKDNTLYEYVPGRWRSQQWHWRSLLRG